MDIPHNTLVVIADGEKMLFLRNEGDEKYPNLQIERKKVQSNPPDRELAASVPGRQHESAAHGSRSYDETDFHQLAEDRFARETAELLKKRALANEFERLIVAAPPRTLGEIRQHYHVEVQSRLIGEVDKELTGHPLDEIETIITAS